MITALQQQTDALRLTTHAGIADTVGAAWALARFGDQKTMPDRSGDAIEQEARATRSRAFKRRNWERGGTRPIPKTSAEELYRIAPTGGTMAAIAPLPVAALRLSQNAVTALARVGLRRISDLLGMPRDALTCLLYTSPSPRDA